MKKIQCMVFPFISFLLCGSGYSSTANEVNTGDDSVVKSKDDISTGTSKDTEKSDDITIEKLGLSKKDLYKYGFNVKRAEQIDGVKGIAKMSDKTKQNAMIKILVEKLFTILTQAKQKVIDFGYIPGGDFPDEQENLDALGNVFENVALFGDLVLRIPDATHRLYDNNKTWQLTMHWAVVFANESGIFDGANEKLLNLLGQELNIIPRQEDYVNPYKEAAIQKEKKKKMREERIRKRKEQSKKSKRKKKKGPRLGGGRRTEL